MTNRKRRRIKLEEQNSCWGYFYFFFFRFGETLTACRCSFQRGASPADTSRLPLNIGPGGVCLGSVLYVCACLIPLCWVFFFFPRRNACKAFQDTQPAHKERRSVFPSCEKEKEKRQQETLVRFHKPYKAKRTQFIPLNPGRCCWFLL